MPQEKVHFSLRDTIHGTSNEKTQEYRKSNKKTTQGKANPHSQLLLVIDFDEHLRARGGRSNVELCCRQKASSRRKQHPTHPRRTEQNHHPNHDTQRVTGPRAHGQQREERQREAGGRCENRVRFFLSTLAPKTLPTNTCSLALRASLSSILPVLLPSHAALRSLKPRDGLP